MKANAPEKIYIDDPTGEFDNQWCMYPNNDSIEYTRTDAFIEKVKFWLSKHFYDECYQSHDDEGTWIDADDMIEDLTKYMRGEKDIDLFND